jgi:catechol 2,3-dioxygenase-like lactoylglutathione lyase family enzyme
VRFNSVEPRIHVADFARSLAFYRDVLGFEVLAVFPEDKPVFALVARDGVAVQIGGPEARKDPGAASNCTLYFDVRDALAVHERLKGKVKVEWGPEVFFYHRREFAFRDPDGHLLIISEETDEPVTSTED